MWKQFQKFSLVYTCLTYSVALCGSTAILTTIRFSKSTSQCCSAGPLEAFFTKMGMMVHATMRRGWILLSSLGVFADGQVLSCDTFVAGIPLGDGPKWQRTATSTGQVNYGCQLGIFFSFLKSSFKVRPCLKTIPAHRSQGYFQDVSHGNGSMQNVLKNTLPCDCELELFSKSEYPVRIVEMLSSIWLHTVAPLIA